MKVLHVIDTIAETSGGLSRACQGLVAALCDAGVDTLLLSLKSGEKPWHKGIKKYYNDVNIVHLLETEKPDIVHINNIWRPEIHRCVKTCQRLKIPYIMTPHGCLEPWSLKQKWLKKRIARFLYQDADIRDAIAIQATAESEAEQFRKLGFTNTVIISPNGVNVPSDSLEFRVESLELEKNERRALFVSRMHPKKGVLELVEAWGRLVVSRQSSVVSGGDNSELQAQNSKLNQWTCELVYTTNGDFEKAYESKVKSRILELGMSYQDIDGSIHSSNSSCRAEALAKAELLHSHTSNSSTHPLPHSSTSASSISPNFIFTGPLDDDAKWEAYRRADFFVLPTYSENFGIVVAEAMYAELPVITTKGAPWADLQTHNCGWWIEIGVEELVAALKAAMSLNDDERRAMGRRGRQLVETKYTWDAIGQAMAKAYGGLVG